MHLILTGATGLVGSGVLHQMLAMEGITKISILSHRPVPMAEGHEVKVKVIIHNNFKEYPAELLEQLKDAHGVVWAQGISQSKVSKAEYREITYDYPLAAARAFSTLHPTTPFTFVYVSGEGATQTPGLFTPLFARVKGEAETALFNLGSATPNLNVYNVRPGGVDWREHKEIHAYMTPQPALHTFLLGGVAPLIKGMMIPTRPLGRILTELAMSQGKALEGGDGDLGMEGRLVTNQAIRRLAGLREAMDLREWTEPNVRGARFRKEKDGEEEK